MCVWMRTSVYVCVCLCVCVCMRVDMSRQWYLQLVFSCSFVHVQTVCVHIRVCRQLYLQLFAYCKYRTAGSFHGGNTSIA